jgi:phosphomannomutase
MVYYAIGKLPCDGGMAVTASHNPKQYIGFKLCKREARPLSGDTGIQDIEKLVRGGDLPPAARKGKRDFVDVKADWIKHIAGFAKGIQPMTIAGHLRGDPGPEGRAALLDARRHLPEPRGEPAEGVQPR